MRQRGLPDADLIATCEAIRRHRSMALAAAELRIGRSTVWDRYQQAIERGLSPRIKLDAPAPKSSPPGTPEAPIIPAPNDELRDRVFELEAQLRSFRSGTLDDEYVRRKIIGLRDSKARIPEWALRRPADADGLPGVPSALWSDWHWGEVVEASQIGGVNSYDTKIAHGRARELVERTIYLLRQHVVNPEFPGIVINLGGDMFSGDIHDELSQTNDAPLMPAVLDLYGVLIWAIRKLADEFGNVFLPCVTGNHGRNTKKPRAKGRNYTNFDWLLYQFLSKAFENDDRVMFLIPDGPDALYRVYGHRYLLTHGDQFRGGDGQIGAIGPITRGNKRKLARNSAINREYDTMLLGHWHQYMPLHRQIVNGSLKGYDEYANANNFEFEPPTQALWLTHPTHGITIQMPVYLDSAKCEGQPSDWVSWRDS